MTKEAFETLSQQAIFAAGVVYFLALLVHLAEWSSLRTVPAEAKVLAGSGGPDVPETATEPAAEGHRPAFLARLGVLLIGLAALVQTVGVVTRGLAADPVRVPWSNMYEFTISGTLVVAVLYLVALRIWKASWLGVWVALFNVAMLMIAVIWLYAPVATLRDALDSPWLVIHVVSAIIATGAFTLGGFTSLLYLLKNRWGGSGRGYLARLPELRTLDLVSDRIHAFGFPVWTFAVLITGPIWAHQAWSSYWSWDPKEVWAFITWVVYAAYLHARTTAGWKGSRAAWLALVGLATLWFNFIGINYFSSTSQHSYAGGEVVQVVDR